MIKRVYLIEDEPMVLDFVTEFFQHHTDLEVVGSSGNGQEALKAVLELKPDLVLVDIRLPEVNGLEILTLLKRRLPECKVLIFTGTVNPHSVRVALQAGTDGFIEKAEGLEGLRRGLAAIQQDKRYFSEHVKRMMVAYEENLSTMPPFPRDPAEESKKA
jgi:DNA-binding NarL/FixJ family response regulator